MFALSRCFAAVTAIAALAACSNGQPMPAASEIGSQPSIVDQASGKLTVNPTKLNFTTTPTLKLTISEKGYTGKFVLTLSPAGIVTIKPASGKGPSLKAILTAVAAGKATLTAKDANGHSKAVPITVTQGVIIIQ